MTMNERKLRYIMEIAKEGSITNAAQNLFITQPSLSNLLLSVEDELGVKLFDRSVSPMVLTYAGEKYIAAAGKIFDTIQELQCQIDNMKDSMTGRLNIGCGSQQSPFLVPEIFPAMIKKYPGIELNLFEDSWNNLEEQLLKGTLDAVLYGRWANHPNIEYIELSRVEMVLLSPLDFHPMDVEIHFARAFPCIDLQKLDPIPLVLMKRGHQMRASIDNFFRENQYKPNIMMETDNWMTCLRMVENGAAFTILPDFRSGLYSEKINRYSFLKEYNRQTFLCYRKNTYFPKIMEAFISVACEALKPEEQ